MGDTGSNQKIITSSPTLDLKVLLDRNVVDNYFKKKNNECQKPSVKNGGKQTSILNFFRRSGKSDGFNKENENEDGVSNQAKSLDKRKRVRFDIKESVDNNRKDVFTKNVVSDTESTEDDDTDESSEGESRANVTNSVSEDSDSDESTISISNEQEMFESKITIVPLHQDKKPDYFALIKLYCDDCGKNYMRVGSETKENLSHCPDCETPLLFQCMTCKKTSKVYYSTLAHVKSICVPEFEYRCNQCNYVSNNRTHLKTHVQLRHTEIVGHVNCSKCGKRLRHILSLRNHERICGIEAKFECRFCPYKSKWSKNYKEHLKKHASHTTEKKVLVSSDGVHLTIQENTKNSAILVDNDKPIRVQVIAPKIHTENETGLDRINKLGECWCNRCKIKKKIMSTKNETVCQKCSIKMIIICKKCKKSYQVVNSFYNHLRLYCPESKYKRLENKSVNKEKKTVVLSPIEIYCTKCNNTEKATFGPQKCRKCKENNKFRCFQCSKEYTLTKSLRLHMKNEHPPEDQEQQIFQCSKCAKTFAHQIYLRKHARYCLQALPDYKCDYCNHQTKYKSSILKHIKGQHLGIKVYSKAFRCDKCSTTCTDAETLQQHKEKGCCKVFYFCDECGGKFRSKIQLVKHMKSKEIK